MDSSLSMGVNTKFEYETRSLYRLTIIRWKAEVYQDLMA
jgi:hypothetical protein